MGVFPRHFPGFWTGYLLPPPSSHLLTVCTSVTRCDYTRGSASRTAVSRATSDRCWKCWRRRRGWRRLNWRRFATETPAGFSFPTTSSNRPSTRPGGGNLNIIFRGACARVCVARLCCGWRGVFAALAGVGSKHLLLIHELARAS